MGDLVERQAAEQLLSALADQMIVTMRATRYRSVLITLDRRGGHTIEMRLTHTDPEEIERLRARVAELEARGGEGV